jgi:hypothetical protein
MNSWNLDLAPVIGSDRVPTPKCDFRDRHELRSYVRAVLVAERLLAAPELIERGRAYLDRFVKGDPRQRNIYRLWAEMLQLPVGEIANAMLADDPQGALLRETAPVFEVVPVEAVNRRLRQAAR